MSENLKRRSWRKKFILEQKNTKVIRKLEENRSSSPLQKAILILLNHPLIKIDHDIVNDDRISDNKGIILLKSILELIKLDKNINMGENYRAF